MDSLEINEPAAPAMKHSGIGMTFSALTIVGIISLIMFGMSMDG